MRLAWRIDPLNRSLAPALQDRINRLTKPLGALGHLETLALQAGLIQNTLSPELSRPAMIVFAGDHGLVEAGVSAYPQSVTAQMVTNFLNGGGAINVFAGLHGIDLLIVNSGVNADLDGHDGLINLSIGKGTANILEQPAMTPEQCQEALHAGADLVLQQHQTGRNCIGFGEMGIGNSSSAALLMQSLTGLPLSQCVGRGAGLDDKQLENKFLILEQALNRHRGINSPLAILATFGGFEIAMMTGAYLKAAECRMLIAVDGFIAASALLVAAAIAPAVLDYCVFSHVSFEHGHRALLDHFGARPLLDLGLRLGEGTGAALAFPLIQSAVAFLNGMATFREAGVDGQTG